MKTKVFLTLDEQINLLKSRGLKFNNQQDLNKFKWYLEKYNYHNFVNGYNDLFMVNKDRKTNCYLKECNSNNIIDLFNLDRKLVSLLIGPILNIERCFALYICYEIMYEYQDILKDGLILTLTNEQLINIFPKIKSRSDNTIDSINQNINYLKNALIGFGKDKKLNNKYENENLYRYDH